MSSGMGEVDAPTPEVAAYKAQREVTEKRMSLIWRRAAIALGLGFIISIGSTIYSSNLVNEIRTTQNANTARSVCQAQSLDALLKDVPLAFGGDRNVHDYTKIPKSC